MRIRAFAMALVVALAAAACGSSGGSTSSPAGPTEANPCAKSNLTLVTPGQLTIGAEFPVAGFVELPIDHPRGFEVDLGAAIAQQLKIPKVRWVNTPFSGLFSPAPKAFDIAINEITATPQRAKVVDFSDSYFDANQGFLIKKGAKGLMDTATEGLRKRVLEVKNGG